MYAMVRMLCCACFDAVTAMRMLCCYVICPGYLNNVVPVKHKISVSGMSPQISSIRNQESEVGLQELVPVVGQGLGRLPAVAPSPAPGLVAPPATPTMVCIGIILEV